MSTGRNGPTQSRTAVARKSRTPHRARRNSGYRISPTAPRVLLGRDDSPRGPCCERVRSLQRGHAARGRIGWSEDRKPVQRHLVRSGRRIVNRKGAVHPTFTKKSITACVLVWDGEEAVQERKKEFGKTRRELEKLRFWLMASKVSVVATESAPGLLEAGLACTGEAEKIR